MKKMIITLLGTCLVLYAAAAMAADQTVVPNHIQRKAATKFSDVYGKGAGPNQAVTADLLSSWLNHRDANIRAWACYALGEVKSPAYAEQLRAMLADQDADVVRLAAKALGKIQDNEAVVVLSEIMLDQRYCCNVRCAAACSLGMIGDGRAMPALCTACKDGNSRIAANAAKSKLRLASSK